MTGRMLSPEQVAGLLPLSRKVIYRMCRSGELPASKVRDRWMIAEADVDALIANGRPGGRPQTPASPPPRRRERSHPHGDPGSLQALRAIEGERSTG